MIGALVRVVSVTNQSGEPIELELIDGMPAVIPYGVSMDSMKNMGGRPRKRGCRSRI